MNRGITPHAAAFGLVCVLPAVVGWGIVFTLALRAMPASFAGALAATANAAAWHVMRNSRAGRISKEE